MAASFPSAVKSFSTKSASDTIASAHMNSVQEEIVAIETAVLPWLTWTDYTPAVTGFTVGNATVAGKYIVVGGIVFYEIAITWGGSTVFAGTLGIALPPVTAANAFRPAGNVIAIDAGTATWGGHAWLSSTSALNFYTGGTNAGAWSNTAPFTWVATDSIIIHGFYAKA